jgi:OOP family OmpA-OmpF porin
LCFTSERQGQRDLFVSTRSSKAAEWRAPVNLGGQIDDPAAGDFSLRLSADGSALYFASNRKNGFGKADIYVARRASRQQSWGPAVNLGPQINTESFEAFPTPNADATVLYFNRSTTFDSQDSDIWMSTRVGSKEEWSAPRRLPAVINSERAEFSPSISADGNVLYFASERDGSIDVWVSTRTALAEWDSAVKLGREVNVPGAMTLAPFISRDGQALYFMSARPNAAGTACTPLTCFDRVDLYVARATCH